MPTAARCSARRRRKSAWRRRKDGDVIIAHINQPTHSAGAGLVKGLLDLKAKGVTFVRLDDAGGTIESGD